MFNPIDLKRWSKDLKLEKRGEQNGLSEYPTQDAQGLDEVEQSAISAVLAERAQVHKDMLLRISELNNLISTARARLSTNDLEVRVVPLVTEVEREASIELEEVNHKRERLDQQIAYFAEWREMRALSRPAKSPKPAFSFFSDLAFIAVLEAMANLYFFSEGNPAGLLGAFFQALLIAVVNISLFAVLGFVLVKRIHSVFAGNKMTGFVGVAAVFVSLPLMHSIVGFYRLAFADRDNIESSVPPLQQAIQWFANFEFWRYDELSVVMVIMGVIAGAYAVRKGYGFGDEYPDYTKKYWETEGLRAEFLDEIDRLTLSLGDKQEDALQEVRKYLYEIAPALESLETGSNRKQQLASHLRQYEEHLEDVANGLLKIYRGANIRARTSEAPKGFSERFSLPNRFFDGDAIRDPELSAVMETTVDFEIAKRAAEKAQSEAEA
ncbi:MAG: hypothetical protein VXW22_14415, partial [Pseudomonadota bacterium]|nr:hypothetical protein [Pseudomonadota bacterium]